MVKYLMGLLNKIFVEIEHPQRFLRFSRHFTTMLIDALLVAIVEITSLILRARKFLKLFQRCKFSVCSDDDVKYFKLHICSLFTL